MTKDKIDDLLDESVHLATTHLLKRKSFIPFAVTNSDSGQRDIVMVVREEHKTDGNELISILRDQMKDRIDTQECIGFAIVSDIYLTDRETSQRGDAISVEIQYRGQQPVVCYVPYKYDDDDLITEEIVAVRGQGNLFNQDNES